MPEEYWRIEAKAEKDAIPFSARLSQLDGEKIEQFTINDKGGADAAYEKLVAAAQGQLRVATVEKKQRRRNPSPPFTTSTLQQEAARKLGFNARRTMRTAQGLYEGVKLGDGEETGLITYMRTDSVNLANDALTEIRQTIGDRYGDKNLPDSPRTFKTKSKNAQEAHEAIRPTASARIPSEIKQYLTSDQFRLYELVWQRTVASQMVHALFDTVSADLAADADNKHLFRASGRTLREAGFLSVYKEGRDDGDKAEDDNDKRLPALEEGETIACRRSCRPSISPSRRRASPKPRWSRRSRNTTSAGRRPMPRSSRRCRIANTWRWTARPSCRRRWARSSTSS